LSHQHQIETTDEEWGQAEIKLSLASIPVTLSWHELSYDIMIPAIGQNRTVLSYVSGWGKPGEVVAFLGGHGAGKTTLLNCLAGKFKIPIIQLKHVDCFVFIYYRPLGY